MKKLEKLTLGELGKQESKLGRFESEQLKGGGIYAVYSRSSGTLSIYEDSGSCLGDYCAGNNVTSSSEGPWPNGTYGMMDQNYPHCHNTGDTYDSSYGTYGIYRAQDFEDIDGDCREGMGLHSGRNDNYDYPTYGCIRTTDAAMSDIQDFINNCGSFTSITITD